MKIAVYGGGFNPPTRAHETIVAACLAQDWLDEVWVMPSSNRHDKEFKVDDQDRLNMLEIMLRYEFRGQERVKLSKLEVKELKAPTQTYETYKVLTERHPEDNFWFVYGADSYYSMLSWEFGEQLRSELNLLLIPRGTGVMPRAPNIKVLRANVPVMSSTQVRLLCQKNEPISQIVSERIEKYIRKNDLYNKESLKKRR